MAQNRRFSPVGAPSRRTAAPLLSLGAAFVTLFGQPSRAQACENVLLAAGYDYFFDGSVLLAIVVGPFLFAIADLYYGRVLKPAFRRSISSSLLRVAALILLPLAAAPWLLLGFACALAYVFRFENGYSPGFGAAAAFLAVWAGVAIANILLWRVGCAVADRFISGAAFQQWSVSSERRSKVSKVSFIVWMACVVALLVFLPTPVLGGARGWGGFALLFGLALLSGAPFLFHSLFIRKDIERFSPGSAERVFLSVCTVIGGVAAAGAMSVLLAIVYSMLGGPMTRNSLVVAFAWCAAVSFIFLWLVSALRKTDSKISV